MGKEVHNTQSTEPEGVFSALSRPFSQGKVQGEERKEILKRVQEQAKGAACAAIKPVLDARLEADVSAKLGREKGKHRRISPHERSIDWQCGHGGCGDANSFIRDGHSRRQVATGWGPIRDVRVPLLECQTCPHDVGSHVAILEKHQRVWMDLDQQVLFGSGFGESVRQMQERWSASVEGRVGWRTLTERITQMEPFAKAAHTASLSDVPLVLQREGMWVTIQSSQETITPDTRKRPRKKRRGKTMGILVALGLWPDGRREILEWQIAGRDDHREWEVLVQRLWEHGWCPEKGVQLVVRDGSAGLGEAFALVDGTTVPEQRCMCHTRQNVSKKGRRERTGQENQEQRTRLLEHAAAISQADTATEALARLARWAAPWREQAPHSVATLERDFARTLVFYDLTGMDLTWRRTASW